MYASCKQNTKHEDYKEVHCLKPARLNLTTHYNANVIIPIYTYIYLICQYLAICKSVQVAS